MSQFNEIEEMNTVIPSHAYIHKCQSIGKRKEVKILCLEYNDNKQESRDLRSLLYPIV